MTRIDRVRPGIPLIRSAAVAAAASLMILAAGCAAAGVPGSSGGPGSALSTTTPPVGQRIVVRFDDEVVPATLADTTAGRDFAALLPLTVELRDPMGQAKSGRLPAPIALVDTLPVTDPDAGGIYYAPGSRTLAVFYDDLGQTVPPPGLVRLGAVDNDLASIAAAGNRIQVRIDVADDGTAPDPLKTPPAAATPSPHTPTQRIPVHWRSTMIETLPTPRPASRGGVRLSDLGRLIGTTAVSLRPGMPIGYFPPGVDRSSRPLQRRPA